MRVPIDTDSGFVAGAPERIIETRRYYTRSIVRTFDVSPDGERFLMVRQGVSPENDPYGGLTRIVVYNWFDELNALTERHAELFSREGIPPASERLADALERDDVSYMSLAGLTDVFSFRSFRRRRTLGR